MKQEKLSALTLGTLIGVALLSSTLLLFLAPQGNFSLLAESFLQGKTYLLGTKLPLDGLDAVFFQGRYYWPLFPFPAVLIAIFFTIGGISGISFSQGNLQFILVLATWFLVYKIARRFSFNRGDALLIALAFHLGTMYLGVATIPFDGFLSHVVTVAVLFAALFEYIGRRRWWVVGICVAFALATRVTAGLSALFFIAVLLTESGVSWKGKGKNTLKFLTPVVIVVTALAFYNYARFGDALETGYKLQTSFHPGIIAARTHGIFSPVHIPGNVYHALLAAPAPVFTSAESPVLRFPFVQADPWGMSIFVTSPYLLALFFLRYRERWQKIAWVTVAITAIVLFLYYGVGLVQFGYRYALDFLPLVFLLFVSAYQSKSTTLSPGLRWGIVATCAWNTFLMITFMRQVLLF